MNDQNKLSSLHELSYCCVHFGCGLLFVMIIDSFCTKIKNFAGSLLGCGHPRTTHVHDESVVLVCLVVGVVTCSGPSVCYM